jgi:hypothetical protein
MGLDIFFFRRNRNKNIDAEEVSYFRKVNFLVRFFGDKGFNIAEQIPLEITKGMCEELVKRCRTVLNDVTTCKELLPTMDGFFFGSTAYDKYYIQDVEEVLKKLETNILPAFDNLQDTEYITFETWY